MVENQQAKREQSDAGTSRRIPKRVAQAVIGSLKGGVVPRIGLPYITVGRSREIEALLGDVEIIGEGGASFRFIVGRYGSGKSFLLQTIRNNVMDRGFVVMDADLSPERRLQGATILHSHGMMQELGDDVQARFMLSLRHVLNPEHKENRTIFMAASESNVPVIVDAVNKVTGGLEKSDTGILFTVPIDYLTGFEVNDS